MERKITKNEIKYINIELVKRNSLIKNKFAHYTFEDILKEICNKETNKISENMYNIINISSDYNFPAM
jgi:hypothetical protein